MVRLVGRWRATPVGPYAAQDHRSLRSLGAADAVAGGIDDNTLTLPLATAVIDEIVTCSEEEIFQALRIITQEENMLVEGAAALAMAAYLKMSESHIGKNNVVLLCGGNFDGPRLRALAVS